MASLAQSEGVRNPDHAQTLIEALEYHVERQPDRLTVFLYEDKGELEITYRMLWEGALAYAAGLAARLTPGGPWRSCCRPRRNTSTASTAR